jgi:hypothetical protein
MTRAAEAAPAQNDTTVVKRVSFIMKLWLYRRERKREEWQDKQSYSLIFITTAQK